VGGCQFARYLGQFVVSYFAPVEFYCPCPDACVGKRDADARLRVRLERVRELYGKPVIVNSGVRCPAHNRKVGGVDSSEHLSGLGADLSCRSSRDRALMLGAALAAGFRRVGIAKTFIHVGASEELDQDVVWLYS
jgi:hypothetical protein